MTAILCLLLIFTPDSDVAVADAVTREKRAAHVDIHDDFTSGTAIPPHVGMSDEEIADAAAKAAAEMLRDEFKKQVEAAKAVPPIEEKPKVTDPRPVVIMFSTETEAELREDVRLKRKGRCPPCVGAFAWSLEPNCPVRLDVRPPDSADEGLPAFRWQQMDGVWKRPTRPGWHDEAKRQILQSVPAMKGHQTFTAGPQTILNTIRRFGGDSGSFVFQPDQPQAPNIDGTILRYPSISGRYSLAGVPTIKLNSPTPAFNSSVKGINFAGQLDPTITYNESTNSIAVTGRSGWLHKTVNIKVESGE